MLCLVTPAFVIYTLLTALPVFFYDCPYKTPLTSILSYLGYLIAAYRPRLRRHRRRAALEQWQPEKHLTAQWGQDGSTQGAELDHTALRSTFLTFSDLKDLEEFVGALPGLLQSDSGTGFTRDGACAAQSLLFGTDMLAKNIVHLLYSTVPSALAPADRRRLDACAATCLGTVSLLARACEGATQATPDLWPAWASTYANPVARCTLKLRSQHSAVPTLSAIAESTILLLAWRALVTYRTFLADLHQRATMAASAPLILHTRISSELRSRLSAGLYLALVLHDVLHGIAGDPASGVAPGALLAQRCDELLAGGSLRAHMPGAASLGGGTGAGAGPGPSRIADWDVVALAQATREDMAKAKTCLATLFMHAACALSANAAGPETMRALAAPLPWTEPCEFEDTDEAMRLLLSVRHAHGHERTVFDADEIVALYSSIHDPSQHHAETSDTHSIGGPGSYIFSRRSTWRQSTL
jgi:hypothetical protein